MDKLKIGLVIDTSLDTTEGVPQYVVTIGEWLRGQGHDVHYLAGETKRTDLPNIHSLARNVRVKFNGTATTIPLPASRRRLRRFIREQDFDILHVQSPHHPFMAQRLMLAAGPGTAVVVTFHVMPYGWLSRWGTKALGLLLRPSLRRTDVMLAVSSAAAEYEQWAFGLKAGVSPNTIDYATFHNALPLPKYDDTTLTILYLGRLVPRKGCKVLLQAVNILVTNNKAANFRVVICSSGPLEAELKQYVHDNHLEDIVEFAGFVSEADKPRYYASSDISVFPSSGGESFGIVLLEAMASGKAAVLAGNNPGYASVMQPKQELLFTATDSVKLADKLQELLADEQKRQALAAWGSGYTTGFDIHKVGTQLVTVYKQALRLRRNVQ